MKRNRMIIVSLVSLLLLLLVACGPTPVATLTPIPEATPATKAKPAWEEDWERTLLEARKEGNVTVYHQYAAAWRIALAGPMSQKYGIVLDAITGRSAEMGQRVMMEQRSKAYQADVILSGTSIFFSTLQPQGVLQSLEKVLILPEVVDPNAWWRGELPWLDPDTKTYFNFTEYVQIPIVVNTDLVKPEEVKSWKDLLNPKWKGQIIISDPTLGSGSGLTALTMVGYAIMSWDYLDDLVKQEPILIQDNRQLVEWVARGKFPIVVGARTAETAEFLKAGAPLRRVRPSEAMYLEPGPGFASQPKGSPHPNAAKIFINYLLTKEGQTLSSKASAAQSARADVPTDFLEPINVRQPGVKYISRIDKEFMPKEVESQERVMALFRPLKK